MTDHMDADSPEYALRDHEGLRQGSPTIPLPARPPQQRLLVATWEFADGTHPADGLPPPMRAHAGDAGYDLVTSRDVDIPAFEFKDIPFDIAVALPVGTWAMIIGRSSTFRRLKLLIVPGTIDNGYRGLLYAAAYNLSPRSVRVKKGDRVAQMILFPLLSPEVHLVSILPTDAPDTRGEKGFGSTGR